jgi:proteic killer suppression protein
MIKSFKDKRLRILWETGKSNKLPSDQVKRIMQMLELIDSVESVPQDFEFFRSWKIHQLKGDLRGYWSITVKENWRIIFQFDGRNVFDIDYLDYH